MKNLDANNPELLKFKADTLEIYILGGIRIGNLDRLRVTLKIINTNSKVVVYPLRYNLDLYNSDQCEKLIRRLSEHFEIELALVRNILMGLIESLEGYRVSQLEAMNTPKHQAKELSEAEELQAIKYLKSKNLLQRTMDDIGLSGVVGEEYNRLLMYLVFTSRKLPSPLHIISLGASGTGKTYLQEKVGELIPEEDKIEITSLTKNSLYYFGQYELDSKLILIEDLNGTNDESMYAIRELQTKRRLSKTLAVKDSKGNIRTQTVVVEGKVSIAGTTTKENIYEDNSNRSLLIHIDNSTEQDNNIMEYQRQVSCGETDLKQEQDVKELFKNVQRVLNPLVVRNPYAKYLRLPDVIQKPRRTMNIYLGFIEAITFYHQYQRKYKTDDITNQRYIETTIEDIRWANKLLNEVLIRKSDELSGVSREYLERIKNYLDKQDKNTFTAREIKFNLRINANTLKRQLKELENSGYITVVSGSRYIGYKYQLLTIDDYKDLKDHINSLLDKQLAGIKHNK